MKANELRIGNFVHYKRSKKTYSLHSITDKFDINKISFILKDDKYFIFSDGKENEFKQVNPIPLTEEWLEKFGFKKKYDTEAYWIIEDWGIYYSPFNEGIRFMGKGWIVDFKYVHQLQNLFFALTGTEL